ncbi:hypothetical protein Pmani_024886 [Petrolisthes manimaculis]|uniref:Uncharacterized protein n=1 Tax=Petrolisthes manimaculis TaxID=1843537 RepID=A0AAE1P6Q1_9EUCA|nr:hypothetical protein Pmani_024886 [Petrolisthes manimaculis]
MRPVSAIGEGRVPQVMDVWISKRRVSVLVLHTLHGRPRQLTPPFTTPQTYTLLFHTPLPYLYGHTHLRKLSSKPTPLLTTPQT